MWPSASGSSVDGAPARNRSQFNAFMPSMRAAQVSRPNGSFELVNREIPQPGPGSVRIKVQAIPARQLTRRILSGSVP